MKTKSPTSLSVQFAVSATLLSLGILLLSFVSYRSVQSSFSRAFAESADALVQAQADRFGDIWASTPPGSAIPIPEDLKNQPTILFLAIVDSAGNFRGGYHVEAARRFLSRSEASAPPRRDADGALVFRKSVFSRENYRGDLITGINSRPLQEQAKSLRNSFIKISLLALALIWGVAGLLYRQITRPLKAAAKQIRQLNPALDKLSSATSRHPFPLLSGALFSFADKINQRIDELQRYQDHLDTFFRLSPIPMLITDAKGKIEQANQSALELFEVDAQTLQNASLETVLSSSDFQILTTHIQDSHSDVEGYVTAIQTETGQKILEINLSAMHDRSRKLCNYILAAIDVTDKMNTQHEIFENQVKLAKINRQLYQKTQQLEIANEKDKKTARKLARLIEISYDTIRCNNSQEVLEILAQNGRELLDAQDCLLYVWQPGERHLYPQIRLVVDEREGFAPIFTGETVVWRTYRDNQSFFLSSDSLLPEDYQALLLDEEQSLHVITVPISDQDYKYGVGVFLRRGEAPFVVEDLHLITTLAHQTAVMLDKIYLVNMLKEKANNLNKLNQDLQRSQEQVIQLQKMESLGTLVGGIAHDFNNILGIITPNLDLLRMNAGSEKNVMKRAEIIQDAAERAADLTRQLLMFSRNQKVELAPLSANELIRRMAAMFRRALGKHIEVRTELKTDLPNINADATRLSQVLMNLAVNARDAMPDGGVIVFRTNLVRYEPGGEENKPAADYVQISVEDTGAGISKAHLSKIFDPFFTTKSVDKGTGLVLSVVYGIVKSHDGYIEIDTEEGRGSKFHIYFPPTNKPVKRAAPTVNGRQARGSEHILVIDDEAMIRESLHDSLESLGYSITLAHSGEEGVEMLSEKGNIDLAIVDLAMPGWNGVETIEELRKIKPGLKIILSSGYADQEQLLQNTAQIDAFLSKPYHINDLATVLRKVLRKKKTALPLNGK